MIQRPPSLCRWSDNEHWFGIEFPHLVPHIKEDRISKRKVTISTEGKTKLSQQHTKIFSPGRVQKPPSNMRASQSANDWMDDFYGSPRERDCDDDTPAAPPPTPDKALRSAIEEGNEDSTVPRLSPPPHATVFSAANSPYLSSSRRRLVGHAPSSIPAPEITVARRQYYSREQQALYRGQRGADHADALTALAKVAGKKKKRKVSKRTAAAPEERWVTTKNGRVLKLPAKKDKSKKKRSTSSRKTMSRSWPSSRDSYSFSPSSFYHDDQQERQAERAEMERCDRK